MTRSNLLAVIYGPVYDFFGGNEVLISVVGEFLNSFYPSQPTRFDQLSKERIAPVKKAETIFYLFSGFS